MALEDNSWIILVICILFTGATLFVFNEMSKESFKGGMPGVRCGVDLPTCSVGLQCMNGFCEKPSLPVLLPNQLPVFP
jgi:hypothetical protein